MRRGEELTNGADSKIGGMVLNDVKQDLGGSLGVENRPVMLVEADPQTLGEGIEAVALLIGEDAAAQADRTESRPPGYMDFLGRQALAQEALIEIDVVGDEYAVPEHFDDLRGDF